ncbi:aminotransferase class V-fold PLP-dependent enzyme [bacterium]|nr:aminotransferase class V-fold PLP-dependent enzyme [bacterium]
MITDEISQDFPLLARQMELIYLDNAATTQKPHAVLAAEQEWYEADNANPARGLYDLSERASAAYEDARAAVAAFLGARAGELVFTRGATESLNLLAASVARAGLTKDDTVIVSRSSHHANFLPWRQVARDTEARLVAFEPDEHGQLTAEALAKIIDTRCKIVAVEAVSNVLGVVNDIASLAQVAHAAGARLVVDAAQLVGHRPVDFAASGADALVFSGHKMYGPMGIGGVLIRAGWQERLPVWQQGGEMIETVSWEQVTYKTGPAKWEAGTVNAAGAVGLAAATAYMRQLSWPAMVAREQELSDYLLAGLARVAGVAIVGTPEAGRRHGLVSFNIEGVHAHDVAAVLASEQIGVRAGHHCAAPLHQYLRIPASVRVSLSFYNSIGQIDKLLDVLASVRVRLGYDV